jgi:hypothetical protein
MIRLMCADSTSGRVLAATWLGRSFLSFTRTAGERRKHYRSAGGVSIQVRLACDSSTASATIWAFRPS